jgi:hypothetical protein
MVLAEDRGQHVHSEWRAELVLGHCCQGAGVQQRACGWCQGWQQQRLSCSAVLHGLHASVADAACGCTCYWQQWLVTHTIYACYVTMWAMIRWHPHRWCTWHPHQPAMLDSMLCLSPRLDHSHPGLIVRDAMTRGTVLFKAKSCCHAMPARWGEGLEQQASSHT